MWFGIAAAVGNTIAAGIVRPPGDIAQRLPNTYLFLGVWVVGGVYALVGASSMAELGASILAAAANTISLAGPSRPSEKVYCAAGAISRAPGERDHIVNDFL